MWIERKIEGERPARIKLDAQPMSARKLRLKATKHFLWLLVALWTGITFVGYFTPIKELLGALISFELGPWEAFWIFFYGIATYGNAGFLREQVCLYMCPYARFQSVMFDPDTLVISYDTKRGEPRGSRRKGTDPQQQGLGDCVDCGICVQVCPTGIDIRNGLQYQCISCALCIDACDEVMDRLERPRGLIRYDSQNGLEHKPKRFLRPRLGIYAVAGVAGLVAATFAFSKHTTYEANLLRLAGAPYTLDDGTVRNAFDIHLVNKQNHRVTYTVEPENPGGALTFVIPLRQVTLEPLAGTHSPIFVTLPRDRFHGDFSVRVRVLPQGAQNGEPRVITAPFLGPSR